jgi:hypothetical protein
VRTAATWRALCTATLAAAGVALAGAELARASDPLPADDVLAAQTAATALDQPSAGVAPPDVPAAQTTTTALDQPSAAVAPPDVPGTEDAAVSAPLPADPPLAAAADAVDVASTAESTVAAATGTVNTVTDAVETGGGVVRSAARPTTEPTRRRPTETVSGPATRRGSAVRPTHAPGQPASAVSAKASVPATDSAPATASTATGAAPATASTAAGGKTPVTHAAPAPTSPQSGGDKKRTVPRAEVASAAGQAEPPAGSLVVATSPAPAPRALPLHSPSPRVASRAVQDEVGEARGRAPVLPPLHDSLLGLAAAAASSASGGGPTLALLALFLLAIPRMGRWLRPLDHLGRSPAYVSLLDRPG